MPLVHRTSAALRFTSCALALLVATACSDSTEPGSGSGAIELAVTTTGADLDADGYNYSLDGGTPQSIGANATVTLNGIARGTHSIALAGLATNCTTTTPLSVVVRGGATSRAAAPVACAARPVTHPNGVVAATVPISGNPYGVAVSPQGVVYAALIGSTTLAKGDLASMGFGSLVVVGSTPPHVALSPSGATAYATLQYGQGLAIVDVATNSLTATIPLSSDGFNLIVSPSGARVYATTAGGALYVVNAATRSVVTTLFVGAAANGLAFSPNGQTLYVSSRDAGTVSAIDVATNAVTRTYTVGGMPQRLAVAPDGAELYVANEISGVNVVNVATGSFTSVSLGSAGYGLGMTPDGAQLYVLLPDAGEVRVLERATRSLVKAIAVGGRPRNVAFDAGGRTALVANEEAVVFIK